MTHQANEACPGQYISARSSRGCNRVIKLFDKKLGPKCETCIHIYYQLAVRATSSVFHSTQYSRAPSLAPQNAT